MAEHGADQQADRIVEHDQADQGADQFPGNAHRSAPARTRSARQAIGGSRADSTDDMAVSAVKRPRILASAD
jgi:hypothetical protein